MLPDLRFIVGALLATALLGMTGLGLYASAQLSRHAKIGPLETSRSLAFADPSEWNQFYDAESARRFEERLRKAEEAAPERAQDTPALVRAAELPQEGERPAVVPSTELPIVETSQADDLVPATLATPAQPGETAIAEPTSAPAIPQQPGETTTVDAATATPPAAPPPPAPSETPAEHPPPLNEALAPAAAAATSEPYWDQEPLDTGTIPSTNTPPVAENHAATAPLKAPTEKTPAQPLAAQEHPAPAKPPQLRGVPPRARIPVEESPPARAAPRVRALPPRPQQHSNQWQEWSTLLSGTQSHGTQSYAGQQYRAPQFGAQPYSVRSYAPYPPQQYTPRPPASRQSPNNPFAWQYGG